jgi:hypothetical protein
MLTNIYIYLKNYRDEQIEVTKKSTLFQKSIYIYNNTINKLINILYKMKYNNKSTEPVIQFHEECIYY